MSLNGFRIEYHQTRNMGKDVLCGKGRLVKDSDLRLLEVCRWSACISTIVEKAYIVEAWESSEGLECLVKGSGLDLTNNGNKI